MSINNLPFPTKRGYPLPLGVTVLDEGINFSLFSRHATVVVLVIDTDSNEQGKGERFEITLTRDDNKTGDIWHVLLETQNSGFSYGYRLFGPPRSTEKELVFCPEKILIDPFCKELSPRAWGEKAPYGDSPCCRIIHHDFDWQRDRPPKTPLTETIIYELHVRGYTKAKTDGESSPGSYLELTSQIPYLKSLGVTAVELMPVTEFDENDNIFIHPDTDRSLKNFWGYNPVSFFALKSGYAHNPANHINEFKEMVRQFHEAGIEVILDIVYNHTGEGGYDGTTSSFRGIDNPIYYLIEDKTKDYFNFSGCGNTLNCNHPIVRNLIIESLRYWVTEMHIDGFRFDLASVLGRDKDGEVLSNPPMIELITEDPVLRDTKIIAEAWDAAGLYQVGSFSSDKRWAEWNGKFRDDIRAFMAGHDNMVSKLATRFAGSSDLYQTSNRSPLSSINFITSHDGFTLYDLLSYNEKYNSDNGENNRDGDNHNISWNSGFEGSPAPAHIEELRHRRARSLFTLLMLSQGVPMICAGDEFLRTQNGNNNAWCQDNEMSWLDWNLMEENRDMLEFCKALISLRRTYPHFRRDDFFQTAAASGSNEISWQYLEPGKENWSREARGLGILLHGQRDSYHNEDDFFIMVNGNPSLSLNFTLPVIPKRHWKIVADTGGRSLEQTLPDQMIKTARYNVLPFAIVICQSHPL